MASTDEPWKPRFESLKIDIVKALGRGAFGEVSLVKASPLGTDLPPAVFALKRTPLANVCEAGLEHAQSEAKLLQRLGEEHGAILQCFDSRVVHGACPALELLLEYAPLGDLSGRIKAHVASQATCSGGLPETEVVSYGCDVAAGLAHIHSLNPKVLHRDVKPANVVLFPTVDGESWDVGTPRAKLADFGIAKVLEKNGSLAGANTVIGTPHYFSPEICRGESYDERSDAWALGCVLYEMMCLHRPFHQAEGNIAVLALRVMEGRYDKEALVKQAACYNGLLIFALTGLLTLDPQQRSRAAEVMQPLNNLRELSSSSVREAVAWWEVDASRMTGEGGSQCTEDTATGPSSLNADSWAGAEQVSLTGDTATVNPLQEEVTVLHASAMPSPAWKRRSNRTSELLLNSSVRLEGQGSSPPTLANPPTLDPRLAEPSLLSRTRSSPVTATAASLDRTRSSPIPGTTFDLSATAEGVPSSGFTNEEAPDTLPEAVQEGEGQPVPSLHFTSDLGETVRLESVRSTGLQDEDATQPGLAVPSRLAWQGMSGMLDMMSEPPAENLNQSMRSEPSTVTPRAQAAADETTPPQPDPGSGCASAWWAEARIFLRPLWRPAGEEPPPPDAPVMFCFTRDDPEARQPVPPDLGSPSSEAPAAEVPEGSPRTFQPAPDPAPVEPQVLTGHGSVMDPAHGWLEVELTIENATALYAHFREPPAHRPQLGGIFELTAVS